MRLMKEFADNTTMHGFREIYYSKSLLWKFLWTCIVGALIFMSSYQTYKSVDSYLNDSTTTVIQPLSMDVRYPPLRICYIHWLFWLDWNTASSLGFDKQSALYGISLSDQVFSEEKFDVDEAKARFESVSKRNNITIVEFFQRVAFEQPPHFTFHSNGGLTFHKIIIEAGFPRMCYVMEPKSIKSELAKTGDGRLSFSVNLLSQERHDIFVTDAEYNAYMKAVVKHSLVSQIPFDAAINYRNIKVSPLLDFDNHASPEFMFSKEYFQYGVNIRAQVYQWMNKAERPCDADSNVEVDRCIRTCKLQEFLASSPSKCIPVLEVFKVRLIGKFDRKVCRSTIIFMNSTEVVQPDPNEYKMFEPMTLNYNSCVSKCITPCEQWQYTSTISGTTLPTELLQLNYSTQVYVVYPNKESVFVIIEVSSHTWETIVGNLGGIVGLWLGASIVSIVQMIYICCFAGCDEQISKCATSLKH